MERAMALGDEAVRLDPSSPEAYLQWSQAVDGYARAVGNLRAHRLGLGQKAYELLHAVLERRPDEPLAHASLGAWHAEIVAAGFIARTMFRAANKADAAWHFERALELAPESKRIRLEYARRLPRLDRRNGRERAKLLLAEAAALPTTTFLDGILDARVAEELDLLD